MANRHRHIDGMIAIRRYQLTIMEDSIMTRSGFQTSMAHNLFDYYKRYLNHKVALNRAMEPSDLQELYNYNHKVRQNYIDTFQKKFSWQDMINNHETAWLSLKDTILHIIWVEDSWINYSIQGLEDPNRPFPYSKYNSWDAITGYNFEVISKVNYYLSSIQLEDLHKAASRTNIDGIRRTAKVKDVLIHVLTEELHHRGEIIAILWQRNIQPPDMGWLSVMKKTEPLWVLK